MRYAAVLFVLMANSVLADNLTVGPNGINSKVTGLDGDGIEIGQVEPGRSGKPGYGIPPEDSASNTNPWEVYFRTLVAHPGEAVNDHATAVAGVMIGEVPVGGGLFEGVAPKARLHSAAIGSFLDEVIGVDDTVIFALTAQRLARISGADPNDPNHFRRMRAINVSAYKPLQDIIEDTNGNSHVSLFVDWSALRHDVLYVFGWGNSDSHDKRAPGDSFNGMTVAASQQVDPDNGDIAFRMFGSVNAVLGQPADFPRNAISLMAPGQPVSVLGLGDTPTEREGTSLAAPHVTATVALLQQYAKPRVEDGTDPKWNANSQRHETMKAVMMNSADKLAGVHGSTRDVLDISGNDWLQSPAFTSESIPTDPWMGTGHLNTQRALQQFQSGEHDPGVVPSIGWDYHSIGDTTEYIFDSEIGGGYFAATLAWDRRVQKTSGGDYMEGDMFINETPEQRLNNLDLYLMPANSNDFMDAIAASKSTVQNEEHIFFNIASAGQYKLVVHNNPIGGIGDVEQYALAWWFGDPSTPGDYDGNGSVGPEDYDLWKMNFGSTTDLAADGNGNGVVDAADYTIWRDNFGTSGSGSLAGTPVPEPSGLLLLAMAAAFLSGCRTSG